jgi:hypothetical protein
VRDTAHGVRDDSGKGLLLCECDNDSSECKDERRDDLYSVLHFHCSLWFNFFIVQLGNLKALNR